MILARKIKNYLGAESFIWKSIICLYYLINNPIDSILYFVFLILTRFNVYYTIKTKHKIKKIKFSVFNRPAWARARTFYSKEPETIKWIDSMLLGETIWDVGANVGVFTMYASAKGLYCCSFEPSSANYYMLNKNIEINNFKNVKAYCLAFNNETVLGGLNMNTTDVGGALSNFEMEDTKSSHFIQGMMGFTIDGFISLFKQEVPEHIKIDVDGIEDKIIQGMRETIKDKKLKTVLIEINHQSDKQYSEIINFFSENGFVLNKHERFKYGATCNHIFIRA